MNCIVILCDTLRWDHCSPYHKGHPLSDMSGEQAPWVVPTPNIERLASRGTVFDNAWCGSSPCMPARRDIYTGRYEFLERGWGPLEDNDLDLPRQISGPQPASIAKVLADGYSVSHLITDHFHLWEQGAGNYHMGYAGYEFIRGHEGDAWKTDPITFPCPDNPMAKVERHHRNVFLTRKKEEDYFCAQVFSQASAWLQANHRHKDFYLHIDCFDPHEPWDPPEEYVKMFDPRGYQVEHWHSKPPYDFWRRHMSEDELRHFQARYAASVVFTDKWLGMLLDTMDELHLWEDTVVIFTSDHGTFNGDHGRIGKTQTHQFSALSHIPFILVHPDDAAGERRDQLVQLVDIYPTVLSALGRPCPAGRHGVDLLPVVQDSTAQTHEYAISGQFGKSVSITDGQWVLHQSPDPENRPLYWYGHQTARFDPLGYKLAAYQDGRRPVVDYPSWSEPTWLSHREEDPNEIHNSADQHPEQVERLTRALRALFSEIGAPQEQFQRLNL